MDLMDSLTNVKWPEGINAKAEVNFPPQAADLTTGALQKCAGTVEVLDRPVRTPARHSLTGLSLHVSSGVY
jgi:hypothetical protein